MNPGRVIALVIGSLVAIAAGLILITAVIATAVYLTQRDDGFLAVTLDDMESSEVAITAEDVDLRVDPGTPGWLLDALDTDVRIRATNLDSGTPIFVGIAPEADVDRYLSGVGHDEIRDVDDDLAVRFSNRSGEREVAAPTDQDFWERSIDGTGTQELTWEPTEGRWAVAVMNADGSPGVGASVEVGARSDVFVAALIGLFVAGVVLAAIALPLIILGGMGVTGAGGAEGEAAPAVAGPGGIPRYPVTLEARLDPGLSRWMWLVKWFLAIPHLIVLTLLFAAFTVLTFVAGVAILFTGRYPRSIFDFNVGFLRWGWRVSYYAFSGGLGTDRYPPFSLGREPDYPATLDIEYPEQLSRWLVLVKWWLLAIPHYVILAILVGGGSSWSTDNGVDVAWTSGGLNSLLALVAAVILLVTGAYPRPLFDLLIGLNRWVYRVIAYAALMTDRYPPFRLDQGGAEPDGDDTDPAGPHPEPARTEFEPEPVT
jgi:hypothetical protein